MNSKFFVTCLAMPIIVAGCQDESHDDSAQEKAIKAKTLQVSSRTLAAEKRYSGTVEESSGSSLSFSVPGTVSKVYVKTGDRVVKGQPIASIDATTLTSSYHAAKASLDQAQDAYDRLKVSVPEGDIADIQVGDEALVCIPAAENLCLEGRVMEKGIVANPLSRSYEVKIAVENRKHVLLPGMVTDVCDEQPGEIGHSASFAHCTDRRAESDVCVGESEWKGQQADNHLWRIYVGRSRGGIRHRKWR